MLRLAHRFASFALPTVLATSLVLGGCSSSSASAAPVTVHLGYFPNLTHATALVGVHEGIFARDLGSEATLATSTYNAGPAEVQALFAGALDAAYLGANSAVTAWVQSHGAAITVVSGSVSGGAALVVSPSITSAAGLKGHKLATPQLGNTQDVALRTWLAANGLKTDTQGGGDVSILPQDNATTLQSFKSGVIDGAWVPEPWATRLVQEGGGHVLVDEKTLWPDGRFATTVLAVRTAFAKAHPALVTALVQGQVDANIFVSANPTKAQADVNAEIATITGKPLAAKVVVAAWPNLTFTDDPIASSIQTSADHAVALGLSKPASLKGLIDVSTLNKILSAAHQPTVSAS